ncbi:hypothetical protein A6A06_09820 [Streptomyces sp. CB02923]|uniref:zf-HC2 domain-containing protein n=1 Tax=Streptomyces sp. CB02923 TaxID=1718985 RepID=UPI00096411E5|nr:zf-HC2 domain-containing protein [Streptomyces sp. CB02923]OKI04972.1 hypothetical protein A6A06_09820 [Streptomyces sp. CB02923]
MQCSRVRTAVSARLDGEELPPGVTGGLLDAHLAGCADCRLWSERAARLQQLTSAAARQAADATDAPGTLTPGALASDALKPRALASGALASDGLLDRLRRSAAHGDGEDRSHHQKSFGRSGPAADTRGDGDRDR